MSIYIKDMEMPQNCEECDVKVVCKNYWKLIREQHTRPSWCPLVPVPPHGDLIDRDEMFVEFVIEGQKTTRYNIGENWELNGEEIRRVIQRLPAVIPADKEGEG